jgi:hypothetical protein
MERGIFFGGGVRVWCSQMNMIPLCSHQVPNDFIIFPVSCQEILNICTLVCFVESRPLVINYIDSTQETTTHYVYFGNGKSLLITVITLLPCA